MRGGGYGRTWVGPWVPVCYRVATLVRTSDACVAWLLAVTRTRAAGGLVGCSHTSRTTPHRSQPTNQYDNNNQYHIKLSLLEGGGRTEHGCLRWAVGAGLQGPMCGACFSSRCFVQFDRVAAFEHALVSRRRGIRGIM